MDSSDKLGLPLDAEFEWEENYQRGLGAHNCNASTC